MSTLIEKRLLARKARRRKTGFEKRVTGLPGGSKPESGTASPTISPTSKVADVDSCRVETKAEDNKAATSK